MVVLTYDRYALGADPLAYFSKSKICRTQDDGATWTSLPAPFVAHRNVVSAALGQVGADYHWIALSNGGDASISVVSAMSPNLDPQTWCDYSFVAPAWQLNKVIYSNTSSSFVAVGFEKDYTTLAEQAVIVQTNTGYDSSTWAKTYQHMDTYSGLYDVAQLDSQNWFAVGYTQNFAAPLMLWSSDALTWTPVTLPPEVNSPLYSVVTEPTTGTVRISGNGFVSTTVWQGIFGSSWVTNTRLLRNGQAKSITSLVNTVGTGTITGMALSGDTIFWSQNEYDYTGVTVAGYTFKSAYWDGTKWYFGVTSRLNQFTGFFGTFTQEANPRLELSGFNNGVHAYSWIS